MQLSTLTEIIRGETDGYWIIEKLLQKRQSILLSGRVADASLLALQISLDVAAGKPFLGEYGTCLGKVLFIDKDKARLQADAQTLQRRPAGMDNVTTMILDAGDERELVRVMKIENPVLTVLGNFPGSLDQMQFLTHVGPVIAIAGTEWSGNLPVNDIWSLNATESGYKLAVKPHGIVLNLSRAENGFALESVEKYVPGSGPVWRTDKVVWKNRSQGGGVGGMNVEQHWTS